MVKIKAFHLLLTVLVLFTSACSQSKSIEDGTNANQPLTESTIIEESRMVSGLKAKDFGGESVRFLSRYHDGYFRTFEIWSEAENGEPINDAIYRRNRHLEESYGIIITETQNENPSNTILNSVLAGNDEFDVVVGQLGSLLKLAPENIYYDLYSDVPNLDFSKSWWSDGINKSLSLANKLYVTVNDLMMVDKRRAYCFIFNKIMAAELTDENLYQLVRDGKWTIDVVGELVSQAVADLNGDGVIDPKDDRMGFGSEYFTIYSLLFSFGHSIVSKDSQDLPEITIYSERTVDAIDKIIPWFLDKSISVHMEDYGDSALPGNIFKDGRCLFIGGVVRWMQDYMKNSEVDMGVLPMPKYDENQPDYVSLSQFTQASCFAVPTTTQKFDITGYTIEMMSYLSKYDVLPLFIEDAVKTKYTTDIDSAEMLDIIFTNITYDIGAIYNWGGMLSILINEIPSARSNIFSSSYMAKEKTALSEMEKTINLFIGK